MAKPDFRAAASQRLAQEEKLSDSVLSLLKPEGDQHDRAVRQIAVDRIKPNPKQPRIAADPSALDDLTASIREHGVLQPILVRPLDRGHYEIVAGERRWRAVTALALAMIPAIIEEMSDEQAIEIAVIENLQRENLNPLEEAEAFQRLIVRFGHTQDAVANAVGKSRSHVANTLRLLKLPDSVKAYINAGKLSAGHARALIGQADPETAAREIVEKGLNVRQVEALTQTGPKAKVSKARAQITKDADTAALERRLSDVLGLKVEIDHKSKGGVVRVRYRTLDQLDDIVRRLERD